MFSKLYDLLFGCPCHRHLSRVFHKTLPDGETRIAYVVCTECGREYPYDLQAMRRDRRPLEVA